MPINQDDLLEDVKLRDYSLDGELIWETPFEEEFYSEESLADTLKHLSRRAGEIGWEGVKAGGSLAGKGALSGLRWAGEKIKKSLTVWRQHRQQKAFATAKYLNERLKLSKELLSQAQSLSRRIGSYDDEVGKIPYTRLWVFKDGQSVPSDLVHALDRDHQDMGRYYTRLTNAIHNQADMMIRIGKRFDVRNDESFEKTVVKPVLELERWAVNTVIPTGGIDFLGNCALVSPSPVDLKDFRNPQEFFKTFWRTRRYQFTTHRNSTLQEGNLEPTAKDLQSMIHAAIGYLTPLVQSHAKLNGLYDRFTALQYAIYQALSEVDTESLRVYQKELLNADQIADVGLAHMAKIIDPMYTRMQFKALTLIHLVERSISSK